MARELRLSGFCGLLILLSVGSAYAGNPADDQEYEIKAAYLYNFTKFVEWPGGRAAAAEPVFVIGVLGSNPFEESLTRAVSDKSADGRPIVVEHVPSVAALRRTARPIDMLFIESLPSDSLSFALEYVRNLPVLTIGEQKDFCGRGGIINFVIEKNRIRFEIDPAAAGRAELKISSKLLHLAVHAGTRS